MDIACNPFLQPSITLKKKPNQWSILPGTPLKGHCRLSVIRDSVLGNSQSRANNGALGMFAPLTIDLFPTTYMIIPVQYPSYLANYFAHLQRLKNSTFLNWSMRRSPLAKRCESTTSPSPASIPKMPLSLCTQNDFLAAPMKLPKQYLMQQRQIKESNGPKAIQSQCGSTNLH